jgi:RNA polymerase sigma factor for flagellar operon FliA
MNTASMIPDLARATVLARSILPGALPVVRMSVVPQPAPRATLPPAARATRMMGTVRRIAASIAKGLPAHVDLEDLVGAGAVGLAEAFTRRNGMPAEQFEAFAVYRIRGAIYDELRRLDVMSRRNRDMWKRMQQADRAVAKRRGAPGDDVEVAAELGLRPSYYRELRTDLELQREPISLSAARGDDEEGDREIADATAAFPEEAMTRASVTELALEGIAKLPERMRHVLLEIYTQGKTLKQVGAELGVTESRVCQIHREALRKLRAALPQDEGAALVA